jgi:hypothetical protein
MHDNVFAPERSDTHRTVTCVCAMVACLAWSAVVYSADPPSAQEWVNAGDFAPVPGYRSANGPDFWILDESITISAIDADPGHCSDWDQNGISHMHLYAQYGQQTVNNRTMPTTQEAKWYWEWYFAGFSPAVTVADAQADDCFRNCYCYAFNGFGGNTASYIIQGEDAGSLIACPPLEVITEPEDDVRGYSSSQDHSWKFDYLPYYCDPGLVTFKSKFSPVCSWELSYMLFWIDPFEWPDIPLAGPNSYVSASEYTVYRVAQ